jgi:peptidoglycan/xylan/chitin deacetylase (PgdA/CDA1 family)/ribosomal protein S18 acetylase RimI-like enzyme
VEKSVIAETAKRAWLTIDDAPTEDMRQRVDELNARGIRAVWFCLGELLERYPEQAAYAVANGHILGNHSYDHPAFSKISLEEARKQIERTERLLDGICAKAGVPRPVKLFRFPYLDDGGDGKRGELQSMLRRMGFEQPGFPGVTYAWWKQNGWQERIDVGCTYDTWDWRLQEGGEMLPKLLARMDEHEPEHGRGLNDAPGSNEVVMMHAWIPAKAFRQLLDRLQAKPLRFDPPVHLAVRIRPAEAADLAVVHPFQCDYLDRESAEEWKRRLASNPGMYLAAFAGDDLAGICYGHPSRRREGAADLQGIAVNLDHRKPYARRGIGSRLLRAFERVCAEKGFRRIGVGSADDPGVEAFYRTNGYRPVEIVAKDADGRELERAAIPPEDADRAKERKEALRRKHGAAEVIFIFAKTLD